MSLKYIGYEGVERDHLGQDRDLYETFLNTAMDIPIP
jgi:hypothetical protein